MTGSPIRLSYLAGNGDKYLFSECPICFALLAEGTAQADHRDWHRTQAESHVRALEGSEGR